MDYSKISSEKFFYDVIYNPSETNFLRSAKKNGNKIENGKKINSQKLKLPSGKVLKGSERKKFEVSKIKIDVLKSNLISELN